MNIWKSNDWKSIVDVEAPNYRSGLRLVFEKDVDSEVKRASTEFIGWLRSQYYFPIRIPIYFKTAKYIRTQDGDLVPSKIFEPFDKTTEPYITIATGDIQEKIMSKGKDNALAGILGSIVHELTHYFQWINDVKLTDRQAERQANYYRKKFIQEYASIRDHP